MKIYTSSGTEIIDVVVDDGSERQAELMGHDMLTLRFSLVQSVDFPSRCYCYWGSDDPSHEEYGRKYIMFNKPECTKKHSRQYDYVLTMYTYEYYLSIIVMRDLVINYTGAQWSYTGGNKTKFPLTATPREHLQMIADCLNKAEGSEVWKVDYSRTIGMTASSSSVTNARQNYDGTWYLDEGETALVNYDGQYCIDAIKAQAEAFHTEYEIEDATYNNDTYHLLCMHKVEYHKSAPLHMKYGKGQGFVSGIARRNQTETPPLDRLYVQGGEQNIGEHYGQTNTGTDENPVWTGTKENTLMLPANVSDIRYDGEHLYVRVTSNVGTVQYYYYYDNVLRYSYGVYSGVTRYKDEVTGDIIIGNTPPSLIASFDYFGQIIYAEGWKRYLISEDRRSFYRVFYDSSNNTWNIRSNVEGFYDGSEVYPMRVGGVSYAHKVKEDGTFLTDQEAEEEIAAGRQVYYDIFDGDTTTLGTTASGKLDYADCGVGGETMTVIFQDGMLAGREFEIQTVGDGTNVKPNCGLSTKTSPTSYRIPLCQSEQDGFVMPTEPFVPAVGDHYIVFHCQLPDKYVTDAEMRMLWQAVDYMFYKDDYTYSFSGKVDVMFASNNWSTTISPATSAVSAYMAIGQYINVSDVDLFGASGQTMRVTAIRQKVNRKYDIDLTLTNAPQNVFDWAKKLSATVREVNVRPPRWRPWNHILPPQMRGMRNSIPILNVRDVTNNVSDGGGSRRNSMMPVINSSVEALDRANTYLSQCQEAVNDICNNIAMSTDFNDLKNNFSVDPRSGKRANITEIGNGDGSCSVVTEACEPGTLDIIVPKDIK